MSAQPQLTSDTKPGKFSKTRAHAAAVEGILCDTMVRRRHSDVEEFLDVKGREWARLMYEEHLSLRAELERRTDVTGADGECRTAVRPSERQLDTVLGRVTAPRLAYQTPGGPALHPMDASLNLPREMFSHGVRKLVAKLAAVTSFDEVAEMVRDYKGSTIGKRQVEELAARAAQDFEGFYERRAVLRDPRDDLLVISTDGKGIVMRPEDLREGTRRAAEKAPCDVQGRLTPQYRSSRKRMAQVAAVYSIAAFPRTSADILRTLRNADELDTKRPRPAHKRVWASVENSQHSVISEAFSEALRRDPERQRRWIVLVDGDPKQLRSVKEEAKRANVKVTIILDIVHVMEYVWDAAHALFGEKHPRLNAWVTDRILALLSGRTGGDVARTIRWWAARTKDLSAAAKAAIDKTCKYLASRTRTRLMHYQQALRDGLPIATGVIEGACRHLVKDRMDRTGAKWSLTGAEAILRLRALRTSGDFDDYWEFHLAQEHARNHASHYEDAVVPDPLPSPKLRLRRIK